MTFYTLNLLQPSAHLNQWPLRFAAKKGRDKLTPDQYARWDSFRQQDPQVQAKLALQHLPELEAHTVIGFSLGATNYAAAGKTMRPFDLPKFIPPLIQRVEAAEGQKKKTPAKAIVTATITRIASLISPWKKAPPVLQTLALLTEMGHERRTIWTTLSVSKPYVNNARKKVGLGVSDPIQADMKERAAKEATLLPLTSPEAQDVIKSLGLPLKQSKVEALRALPPRAQRLFAHFVRLKTSEGKVPSHRVILRTVGEEEPALSFRIGPGTLKADLRAAQEALGLEASVDELYSKARAQQIYNQPVLERIESQYRKLPVDKTLWPTSEQRRTARDTFRKLSAMSRIAYTFYAQSPGKTAKEVAAQLRALGLRVSASSYSVALETARAALGIRTEAGKKIVAVKRLGSAAALKVPDDLPVLGGGHTYINLEKSRAIWAGTDPEVPLTPWDKAVFYAYALASQDMPLPKSSSSLKSPSVRGISSNLTQLTGEERRVETLLSAVKRVLAKMGTTETSCKSNLKVLAAFNKKHAADMKALPMIWHWAESETATRALSDDEAENAFRLMPPYWRIAFTCYCNLLRRTITPKALLEEMKRVVPDLPSYLTPALVMQTVTKARKKLGML